MPTLLVVDDEPNIPYTIAETMGSESLKIITAGNARDGVEAVRRHRPDVVLLDVRLPDMSGLDAFEQMREFDPRIPVVIMTAYARTETAIEAMSRGAFDYLLKPVDFHALQHTIGQALEVSRLSHVPAILQNSELEDADGHADRIVGNSAAMQEIYKTIGRVAQQDVNVLILGESGTGKELVARAIYHYSRRKKEPFLAVNCAAIPEALLESELFGHEKGAFTGADQRRIGKFEQVDGGTLFLDEIGDMAPSTQAKALRLIQEQCFERLGSNETVKTDVRIIAATNQKLEKLVAEGRFRQDLFYRLNGYTIQLPPLRERRDDIPVLVEHFRKVFNDNLHRNIVAVTPKARQILIDHHWPGNVRELQSTIKFAMVHATSDVITEDCLPTSCKGGTESLQGDAGGQAELSGLLQTALRNETPDLYRFLSSEFDRIILKEVMQHFGGNQFQAAERLGISRVTLRAKLRQIGLLPGNDS